MIERFKQAPTRSKVLGGLILVILALGLTGRLSASSGIEITSAEAVEIARPTIEFEPETSQAILVRQGFNLLPVWAVSFSVRTPGGDRNDFDELQIVNVNAVTGEIVSTSADDPDATGGG